MPSLSTTTVVVIATTIGGVLSLIGIVGALLVARRYMRRRVQSANDEHQSAATSNRWPVDHTSEQEIIFRPLSLEQFSSTTERAPKRFSLSSLLHRVLRSKQESTLPSDWAVRNGGHVPRPHRLKKSKCSIPRDSWLLSGIGSSRPVISQMDIESENGFIVKQNQTVKAKIAKISGPSGKSHVVSMVVKPEYDNNYHNLHYRDKRTARPKTRRTNLRKSWLSSNDPHTQIEAQSTKPSIDIPDTGSSYRSRNRRSMSLPFVPMSRPPSTAIPPIPVPSYSLQLFIPKRTNIPDFSPSKRSFASRTTVGSSIFDGLSPSLTKDLLQISAETKRSGSRRMMRRRSSAPSLQMKSFLPEDRHEDMDILARRPSGASSQLLPSPARPLVRMKSQGIKNIRTLQLRTMPQPKILESRTSSEEFQLLRRETPVSFIGLEADWDVFGYGNQMKAIKDKVEGTENAIKQTNHDHMSGHQNHGDEDPKTLRTPKPKVLQKKWTKQECYMPLTFAAIPYSSTVSLDTPLRIPVLGHQASSVYSVPSALPQKTRDQPEQNCGSSLRSITSPFPLSKCSSGMVLSTQTKDDLQTSSPTARQGLFGPRQMSPTLSPARKDAHDDEAKGLGLKTSKYKTAIDVRQSAISSTNSSTSQHTGYQTEEINLDNDHGPYQLRPAALNTKHHTAQYKASIDPPPLRLEPTPLRQSRQSFYGYEAVPNVVPNPYSIPNIATQSTVLPRPLSTRSVAAPRPSSSLSNNFRASIISQPVSRQNSGANNRLSNCGPGLFASSQPGMECFRPISTEYMSSISENNHAITSKGSDISDHGQRLSTSITPLKNLTELCNLFPPPLSGSRPPTWVFSSKPDPSSKPPTLRSSTHCPPSPNHTKPGLPPHPRYYIDQQQNRTSISSTSQTHQPNSSPRKDPIRTLTTSTQTTPSLTSNPSFSSDILKPISLNIGAPTPFVSNQPQARYRAMSPSPSSRGSTPQLVVPLKPIQTNNQLKQRIKARRAQTQAQARNQAYTATENTMVLKGLGITLPSSTLPVSAIATATSSLRTSTSTGAKVGGIKRKAEVNTTDSTKRNTTTNTLGVSGASKRQRSSATGDRKVRFSEGLHGRQRQSQGEEWKENGPATAASTDPKTYSGGFVRRVSACKEDGNVDSFVFSGGRLSASPGRIWREEVF